MNEFKRIIALIERTGGRLSDAERIALLEVALESSMDQLETHTQVRNACADTLIHQRKIWQEREFWNAKCREHNAKLNRSVAA